MNKLETTVPFFNGFYNTIWAPDSELDYYESENGISYDDYIFDDNQYRHDVCENVAKYWQDTLHQIVHPAIRVEFDGVWSPREYNYRTDRCDIILYWDDAVKQRMLELFEKHYFFIAAMIARNHASYPGFISFIEDDAKEWTDDLLFEKSRDQHNYFSHLLWYIVCAEFRANGWDYSLNSDAYESCRPESIEEYITLKEVNEEQKKEIEEFIFSRYERKITWITDRRFRDEHGFDGYVFNSRAAAVKSVVEGDDHQNALDYVRGAMTEDEWERYLIRGGVDESKAHDLVQQGKWDDIISIIVDTEGPEWFLAGDCNCIGDFVVYY